MGKHVTLGRSGRIITTRPGADRNVGRNRPIANAAEASERADTAEDHAQKLQLDNAELEAQSSALEQTVLDRTRKLNAMEGQLATKELEQAVQAATIMELKEQNDTLRLANKELQQAVQTLSKKLDVAAEAEQPEEPAPEPEPKPAKKVVKKATAKKPVRKATKKAKS